MLATRHRTPGAKVTKLRVIRPAPGLHPTRGYILAGATLIPCVIGAGGVRRHKREGDGASPAGRFRIVEGYFRADRERRAPSALELRPIRPDDGWCDDPASYLYNRRVRLPQRVRCETMTMAARSYDVVFVLNYNIRCRSLGRGSAIFLHLAALDGKATAGCVAIAPADMRRLIPRLRRGAFVEIG